MKAHVIKDNKVVNTILVDSLDFMPGLIEAKEGAVGWNYIDGKLSPPVIDLNTLKESICKSVDSFRDSIIHAGLSYTFPDGDGVIDIRNEVDIRNIQGLSSSALALVMMSDETMLPFRDNANVTHSMTPPQVVEMGQIVASYISKAYQVSWNHKDTIRGLETVEAVMAYDYTGGWE